MTLRRRGRGSTGFTYCLLTGHTPTPSTPGHTFANTIATTSFLNLGPGCPNTSPPKLVTRPFGSVTGPTPSVGTSQGAFVRRKPGKL